LAFLRCNFYSEALGFGTSMTVILPQTTTQVGLDATTRAGGFPTLYLLHGRSDDDTVWQRLTSIERYAAPLGLAVVMPAVQLSFYADEAWGHRYWTFLSEELPGIVRSFFRVSDRREDTFVAGLSMGGYGALKLALRRPDRFAAAASLSGVTDLAGLMHHRPEESAFFDHIFTEPVDGTDDDLMHLLAHASPEQLPKLFVACGTQDRLIDDNHRFVAAGQARGVDVTSRFDPGDHEWGYWDDRIQDVLAWLPLATRG
jgi:putative tributyrin esterase